MDEDDLKWLANEKNILLLLKQLRENFRSKSQCFMKLSHCSVVFYKPHMYSTASFFAEKLCYVCRMQT